MATSTITYIKDQVRIMSKLNTNTLDDTLLMSAIALAIYDIAHAGDWPELNLTYGFPAAAQVLLPANFMKMDRVRYTSGTSKWRLSPRESLIIPPLIVGKPRAYSFEGQANGSPTPFGLNVEPIAGIVGSDGILIDYYRLPTSPFDSPNLDSPNWDSEIITRGVQYVLNYLNKTEQINQMVMIRGMGGKQ